MILLILLDGSPFLIIGNFIEGIIFIMIILPPTTRNVEWSLARGTHGTLKHPV